MTRVHALSASSRCRTGPPTRPVAPATRAMRLTLAKLSYYLVRGHLRDRAIGSVERAATSAARRRTAAVSRGSRDEHQSLHLADDPDHYRYDHRHRPAGSDAFAPPYDCADADVRGRAGAVLRASW